MLKNKLNYTWLPPFFLSNFLRLDLGVGKTSYRH